MDGHSRSEQEYDVVENLEMQEWHVPARPLNPDTTYAGRRSQFTWFFGKNIATKAYLTSSIFSVVA